MTCLCRSAFERSHCAYAPQFGGTCRRFSKPRVRVKAPSRILGVGVPDDAQPGDLVIGNRGAAAEVLGDTRILYLYHVGNFYDMPQRRIESYRCIHGHLGWNGV